MITYYKKFEIITKYIKPAELSRLFRVSESYFSLFRFGKASPVKMQKVINCINKVWSQPERYLGQLYLENFNKEKEASYE